MSKSDDGAEAAEKTVLRRTFDDYIDVDGITPEQADSIRARISFRDDFRIRNGDEDPQAPDAGRNGPLGGYP